MHACHSASAACRPAETAGRRGEIGSVRRLIRVGQISPISVKGLLSIIHEALFNSMTIALFKVTIDYSELNISSSYCSKLGR